MRTVALVELSVFERITPLVSGYLQAYAAADPVTGPEYRFRTYTTGIRTSLDQITREVLALEGDIYGFSCYVWNMGLMRKLAARVRAARPDAHVVLGGPQAMRQGLRYLDPHDERTVVCDGEGEATFTEYLRELTNPRPDLATVNGLSFFRDGQFVTTPERPRISDLDTIPSPFLTGVFKPGFSMTILETNRGCPYHCGFCFWGAATNDRVYRFDEDRIREEINWTTRNEILFLYIADANWGMLARDVDLSEHIAACAREHHLPTVVYFSAAKNKPHAVTKITGIFKDAGLVTSQPVSMQTLEPESLAEIRRSNIKLSAFAKVQEDLRARGLSSYIELIWPLPGETLSSFKAGIQQLCAKDAQTVIVYPHLLLNNTPIFHRQEQLGLVTREAGGEIAEARIVVATQQVNEEQFVAGMWYFYAMYAAHNTRGLHALGRHLARTGTTHDQFFSAFVDFLTALPKDDPIRRYVSESIRDADFYDVNNYGLFAHLLLHEQRTLFESHLRDFVRSQPWWADPVARVAFEIDLVNRPYIYSSTPLDPMDYPFETLRVVKRLNRAIVVEVPAEHLELLADTVHLEDTEIRTTFRVDHKRQQYPFMSRQSRAHSGSYCHGMIEKIESIAPLWRGVDTDRPVAPLVDAGAAG